ncbi:hypothetical protein C882_0136 [Caenispirillum salinarum AK4]|uniref:Gamma-glutamylcyclotransferase AIG2-like domain-containing protein n=1 Tax=Caenispirillum salinarum AK4 TaxID=1238182 RepID=K9GVS3_9PROT|nr:gamma-glutamylcyclotransferase family protein [Caenispirillum salinarum]EKV30055.1 hypothetical protein C882_0136 [Caenispirillum salinarum AK4]
MPEATLYFAYGSNLNAEDWGRWCAARPGTADPACMTPVGAAMLPDHELAFSRHSTGRKGGVLDIRPRSGHAVEGVLMAVSPAGWELLDIKEGVGFAYERIPVRVRDHGGLWRDVTTYRVLPEEARPHVPLHEHYVSVCAEGLRRHGLSPARLLDAAAGRPARSAADGLFIPDGLREALDRALTDAERQTLTAATAGASVHDSGALGPGDGQAAGAFLPSEALEDLVARIDPLAGSGPYRFARDLLTVTTGDGASARAWAYVVPQIT